MMDFIQFYLMAGVYIAVAVLAISAVVAIIEKVLGLNSGPRPHQVIIKRDIPKL